MTYECIDTNVIVRFLVETEESIQTEFKGVFTFFDKLETGIIRAQMPELVLFQTYFVLTSYYNVPEKEAASKLSQIVSFKGIIISEKSIVQECLQLLQKSKIDIVDAWLIAYAHAKKMNALYSYDKGFLKNGLQLLPIE